MPGKVPDRWSNYQALGTAIPGTRLIAFKVPLEKFICQKLPPKEEFSPQSLLLWMDEHNLKLGKVIDLTNTNRYYKPKEFTRFGVEHVKIKTEGHVVPSHAVQSKFAEEVNKFLEDETKKEGLVGVHCTHGVNRTGYLICRYMIDKLNFEPEKAIQCKCNVIVIKKNLLRISIDTDCEFYVKLICELDCNKKEIPSRSCASSKCCFHVSAFNNARGYPIERVNYVNDLQGLRPQPEEQNLSERGKQRYSECLDHQRQDNGGNDNHRGLAGSDRLETCNGEKSGHYKRFGDYDDMQRASNERPRQFEDRPRLFKERPRQFEDRPRLFEDRPRQFEERPRQFEGRPRHFEERPRQFEGRPRHLEERPRQFEDRPRHFEDRSVIYNDRPRHLDDRPRTYDGKSKAFNGRPSSYFDREARYHRSPEPQGYNSRGGKGRYRGHQHSHDGWKNSPQNSYGQQTQSSGNHSREDSYGQFGHRHDL